MGGGQDAPDEVQTSFFAFDTVCVIGGVMSREVLDEASSRCLEFEQLFSRTLEGSDVWCINSAGGRTVEVASETADVIDRSLRYSAESDGLFDITIGAVSELWDFKQGVVPTSEAIERALAHVDYRRVRVEGSSVTIDDPQARIDLGGIAKGYIADDIVALLAARGVESAYVNLGGNVKVLGPKADGTPWVIGVRDPQDESGSGVVATIESTGGSLVTSGLYERRFEQGGRAYWHILDPRTGYPAESDIVSASIYSEQSIDGDGFTKPLFMLGAEGALAFVDAHPGLQACLVASDGELLFSEGSNFSD